MTPLTLSPCSHIAGPAESSGGTTCDSQPPAEACARDLRAEADLEPRRSHFARADIHSGIESTRLRLFVLTGNYWRGT